MRDEPATAPPRMTIDTTQVAAEDAEKAVRSLLADGDDPIGNNLEPRTAVPNEYVDTLFGTLMRSAMATGGRRLAVKWMERLRIDGNAGERAHRAMAATIDLQLRFGILAPPLAEQAGCREDLFEHEQKDADCIARLPVRHIATEGEVRKMRQRLVQRIVRAVGSDTQPQTVDATGNTPRTAR